MEKQGEMGVGSGKGRTLPKKGRTDYTKRPSEKALKYAARRLEHPEEAKVDSLQAAGYSRNTDAVEVERAPTYKRAVRTLEQQREQAADELGLTLKDQLKFFKGVRDMGKHSDQASMVNVAVTSAKAINEMLGFNAPKQVEVKAAGVLIELSELTTAQIEALIQAGHEK